MGLIIQLYLLFGHLMKAVLFLVCLLGVCLARSNLFRDIQDDPLLQDHQQIAIYDRECGHLVWMPRGYSRDKQFWRLIEHRVRCTKSREKDGSNVYRITVVCVLAFSLENGVAEIATGSKSV